MARVELDGVLKAGVEREVPAEGGEHRSQSAGSQNARRATTPMQPGDLRLPRRQAGGQGDLGLQRLAIGADYVVAHRHLGVAAAIQADLAAVWHVQIN